MKIHYRVKNEKYRGAKSSGIAKGKNGGLDDKLSIIGRFNTCVSSCPGQLEMLAPFGVVQVSLNGIKISSQPALWYRQPFDFKIRVLLVP